MESQFAFTPEALLLILGAVTSLIFSYVPTLNVWFAQKPEHYQRLFMLGLLVLITGVVYALGCFQVYQIDQFVCGQKTLVKFIEVLIMAIIANQGIYKITPNTTQVQAIKQAKLAKSVTKPE